MDKTIKELGERALLDKFEQLVDQGDLPFNDDAVAFPLNEKESLVVNIDTFVAKTDAPPNMTFYQMGAKTVTMAISDLAAKGVQPQYLVASGNFPMNLTVKETLEIVQGIRDTAHSYKTKFLGGDTNAADEISLTVTVFGRIKKSLLIKRSGAQEGDIICTTGNFGLTGAGFKVFLDKYTATEEQMNSFYKAVYEPKARVNEGLNLAKIKKITSCIDSSDGLAWCLKEILRKQEKLGILLTQLPVTEEVRSFAAHNELSIVDLIFYGGEEFELVFTIGEKDLSKLENKLNYQIIGRLTSNNPSKIFLEEKGELIEISPKGWEHFK
ncbi:MAG: thiamine-phosphate kinase [Asgard group archaeon]|nr:thiamine-phosphate kinase [Asgard group archaeon]